MLINEQQVDQIARAIHENYRADQTRDGVAAGATPAMTSWDTLDEDKREANRAQARDIAAKLEKVGCAVAAGTSAGRFAFTSEEIEVLARDEQVRWASQRIAAGWRYGTRRDDQAKVHPCLVSWDALPEPERDKDRDMVRNIPTVLAAAGLRVVRRRGRSLSRVRALVKTPGPRR